MHHCGAIDMLALGCKPLHISLPLLPRHQLHVGSKAYLRPKADIDGAYKLLTAKANGILHAQA